MAIVGKSEKTYEYYRNSDPDFRKAIELIRAKVAGEGPRVSVPDFPEFCEKYLFQKLFPHQL